jgi:hypothetical protein
MPTQGTRKWTGRNTGAALLRATTAIAAILVVGCAHDSFSRPPSDVPPALQVPAGQKLTHMLHATGVQIYQCKPSPKDPSHYAWVYQEPKADLSDRTGKNVGRHYAGPTWEGDDGSKVVGEIVARVDAPGAATPGVAARGPNGIQWLLLKAKSNSGKGIFAKVQSIQRVHTIGGLAPPDPCDASHVDQRTRTPYSADYYFYNGRR